MTDQATPEQLDPAGGEIDLEVIATAFRRCAYALYSNSLVGSAPKRVAETYEWMKAPAVGDWVAEITTMNGFRHGDGTDLDAVGILERAGREKIVFSDPDFVWDEEEEGQPHPTEQVWYLRTMDGRLFRWTNASMVAIPNWIFGPPPRQS